MQALWSAGIDAELSGGCALAQSAAGNLVLEMAAPREADSPVRVNSASYR